MAIHVTKDNFVWLDITERCKNGVKEIEELWLANVLYALHDDDSESLLESIEEIEEALKLNLKIGIEVGYIPHQDTRLKYNDIKFGKV